VDISTLGSGAASIERGLSKAFQYSEMWKAVALLDEADVFLEERRNDDLERNNLVSG